MESEIERLRAENDQLKKRLKIIGEQLINNFAYEQRMALASTRGWADVLIIANSDPKAGKLKDQQDEYIGWLRRSLLRLEETREIGMMLGEAAVSNQYADQTTALRLILREIEEKHDYFPNYGDLIFSTNFISMGNNKLLALPIRYLCFVLKRITSDLVLFSDNSTVELHFSNSETQLLIQIGKDINVEKAVEIAGNKFDNYKNGTTNYEAKSFLRLFDGEAESDLIDDRIEVKVSLPLIKMGEADAT